MMESGYATSDLQQQPPTGDERGRQLVCFTGSFPRLRPTPAAWLTLRNAWHDIRLPLPTQVPGISQR